MSDKDNLSDLLRQAMTSRLADVRVAMPAAIVEYDFKTQKASVKPLINRRYADGRISEFPVINNVPVVFPRSGGASLTFPVVSGDTVLLLFCDRSIDAWTNSGGTVNQDDNRMHSLNDAVAIPGLIPFALGTKAKNNEDVLLTYAGAEIEITSDGQINMKSPVKVTVDSPEVRMTGNLRVKGDIYDLDDEYGTFNHIRQIYNIHTHPENDEGGPTDVPIQQLGVLGDTE
ncbi:Gp138 family membrane-puncturing spike protein [Rufibacter sediminis]|uniref:Phage protein Gp138 N-terminal domain-containing protein n=1 Tax=Rufibacter sediminis TaxID=2762756 RepID=A0ABR6VTZ3_9BACT|nr:Gp138 family membrane-puncturing spike protein [Rufibacter sediminis]MBC3540665.1 hypothetical protein [Rufibacter sediminis]